MARLTLARARSFAHGSLVDTTHGTLHVRVKGTGPDVVLIHGVTDNATTWRAVQDRLADRFRVHAIDLPGHGLSDTPPAPLTVRAMGDAVRAYLDAAAIDRTVVAGNSMGGGVSLAVAHLAPERVKGLALLGSIGQKITMPRGLGLLRYRPVAELMSRLADASVTVRANVMRDTFGPDFSPAPQVVEDYFAPWRIDERPGYFRDLMRVLEADEPTPWLREIAVPAHVIHGQFDRLIPIAAGRSLAAALPNAKLTVLPRCGHEPQVELPAETANWIAELAV